ncbi:MAG: hypothetical protein Q8913_12700 [Bacteroidota bacterium]|nr:hypothetical protein [Bacteroidota bacterium]
MAQRPQKGKKKPVPKLAVSPFATPSKYYRIAGLGSSEGDTSNTFPYPTAVLQVLDTVNTRIVVRFPELGMLGVREDTVTEPAFYINDTLRGYEPHEPLVLLSFPKTQYFVLIDVWSRDRKTLLDSRPFEYEMDVQKYHTARLTYVHDPTAGPGAPTLRRPFQPSLLPFSIETNPAWGGIETLDSTGTYSLIFRDQLEPKKVAMSLSMRPTLVGTIDSATWRNFRMKAEMAFGAKGVATSSIGDFQVDDLATRKYIRGGYEFVSKTGDSTVDYVAAFLTPRAILLLFAPMDMPNQQLQYAYFRAIARSLKLD